MEMNYIFDFLADGIFAAIAGVGFGLISNPERRTLPLIAILAACGHVTRFLLMGCRVNIVMASFFGALVIGCAVRILVRKADVPRESLAFPALLPMIPGMYAYGVIQAFIKCLEFGVMGVPPCHFQQFAYNLFMTISIILMMVVGVFLPYYWKAR